MLSKLQLFVTGLSPIAATHNLICPLLAECYLCYHCQCINSIIICHISVAEHCTQGKMNLFHIISFLLSWPWVILVNIIDINNTGIWQISVAEHCTQNKTNLPYNLQSLIRLFISHRYCSCMKQCSDLITVLGIRSIFISWRLGRFQETDSSLFCVLMYGGWVPGKSKNVEIFIGVRRPT